MKGVLLMGQIEIHDMPDMLLVLIFFGHGMFCALFLFLEELNRDKMFDRKRFQVYFWASDCSYDLVETIFTGSLYAISHNRFV